MEERFEQVDSPNIERGELGEHYSFSFRSGKYVSKREIFYRIFGYFFNAPKVDHHWVWKKPSLSYNYWNTIWIRKVDISHSRSTAELATIECHRQISHCSWLYAVIIYSSAAYYALAVDCHIIHDFKKLLGVNSVECFFYDPLWFLRSLQFCVIWTQNNASPVPSLFFFNENGCIRYFTYNSHKFYFVFLFWSHYSVS